MYCIKVKGNTCNTSSSFCHSILEISNYFYKVIKV